ncbi:hypothetical protein, partial [Ferrovum sp.]|uniref:hypothetical protein n=1 Tax=Ferrovum sp. TaxID=2609467 RepID=UPI00261181EF
LCGSTRAHFGTLMPFRVGASIPLLTLKDTLEKLPTWPNSRLDELLPLANPVTIDNPPPTSASQTRSG